MFIKKRLILIVLALLPSFVVAEQPYESIDSMQYSIREFRDSVRQDIRLFRDSVRNARRHAYDSIPHELRVGWGDQMFETLMYRDRGHYTVLPPEYEKTYPENFRYTQHWFFEYLYNVNYWYSFGMMVDYSGVLWEEVRRDGTGKELGRTENHNFHNVAIVPTVRFSYSHGDYVSLYSSLGLGLNINTGSELDYKQRYTALAPVVNITLLGMRVGKDRYFGLVELGGMISLMNRNEIYMFGSRIFTTSFGIRL